MATVELINSDSDIDFDPDTTDITIICSNGKIKTHKFIIKLISTVWAEALKIDPKVTELECNFDPEICTVLIISRFIINGYPTNFKNTTLTQESFNMIKYFKIYELSIYHGSYLIELFRKNIVKFLLQSKIKDMKITYVLKLLSLIWEKKIFDLSDVKYISDVDYYKIKLYIRCSHIIDEIKSIPIIKGLLKYSTKACEYHNGHTHGCQTSRCLICQYRKHKEQLKIQDAKEFSKDSANGLDDDSESELGDEIQTKINSMDVDLIGGSNNNKIPNYMKICPKCNIENMVYRDNCMNLSCDYSFLYKRCNGCDNEVPINFASCNNCNYTYTHKICKNCGDECDIYCQNHEVCGSTDFYPPHR